MVSPGVRTFRQALAVGRLGEDFIMGAHPELRRPKDGERRWDLEGGYPDGTRRTVEVKCDQYPMLDTPNFFAEKHSIIRAQVGLLPGGPWRALNDGVSEFVYLFANGGSREHPASPVAYWFKDLPALVDRINALEPSLGVRRVRSGWVIATGLLVPRDLLAGQCDEVVVYEPDASTSMTGAAA